MSNLIDGLTRRAGGEPTARHPVSSDWRASWMVGIAAGAVVLALLGVVWASLWSGSPGRPSAIATAADANSEAALSERARVKQLVCTIKTTNDSTERAMALRRMSHFAARTPVEALREIEREALRGCLPASASARVTGEPPAWRHGGIAARSNPAVVAYFYPGDLIITGLYEASILSGVYPLARLIDDAIHSIGDVFVGVVSACFWGLALRFGFLLSVMLVGMNVLAPRQDENRPERPSAELAPRTEPACPGERAPRQATVLRGYDVANDSSFRA